MVQLHSVISKYYIETMLGEARHKAPRRRDHADFHLNLKNNEEILKTWTDIWPIIVAQRCQRAPKTSISTPIGGLLWPLIKPEYGPTTFSHIYIWGRDYVGLLLQFLQWQHTQWTDIWPKQVLRVPKTSISFAPFCSLSWPLIKPENTLTTLSRVYI